DPLTAHKTLNYWRRRLAYDEARAAGWDEVLTIVSDRTVREGTRTNLFVVEGGVLVTAPLDGAVLPGIMRGVVLEHAGASGLDVQLRAPDYSALDGVEEGFLTNSVRGIIPVARLDRKLMTAPGPVTRRLWDSIQPWLESGGGTPP